MEAILFSPIPYVICAAGIAIVFVLQEILRFRYERYATKAHARARRLGHLRRACARMERMAVQVTPRTKAVVFGYLACVEAEAHRLGVSDMYPVDATMQTLIRNLAGVEAVK